MRSSFDLNLISKFFVTGIIAVVVLYVFTKTAGMSASDSQIQADRVAQLIDKALVQCFALEGSYPSDSEFHEKMAKYGVILNTDKYHFYYSAFSANIAPDVIVLPKQ